MLGPNGDSNGCVSFKDYYAFLDAYRNKGIRRLAVLAGWSDVGPARRSDPASDFSLTP